MYKWFENTFVTPLAATADALFSLRVRVGLHKIKHFRLICTVYLLRKRTLDLLTSDVHGLWVVYGL